MAPLERDKAAETSCHKRARGPSRDREAGTQGQGWGHRQFANKMQQVPEDAAESSRSWGNGEMGSEDRVHEAIRE